MHTSLRLTSLTLAVLIGGLASCDNLTPKSDPLMRNAKPTEVSGQVVFRDKDGGFYGILTDNGAQLEPINLDSRFQFDGARISIKGKLDSSRLGTHSWGNPVEIVNVRGM